MGTEDLRLRNWEMYFVLTGVVIWETAGRSYKGMEDEYAMGGWINEGLNFDFSLYSSDIMLSVLFHPLWF